ncbi:MAG: hypothetical protein DDT31_01526 [Syntrophomonadaceae bacterium]|nr:hypothetical protein [Bacillota bacterium]
MIEKIQWQGKTLALILREGFDKEGVNFVTTEDNPIQLGVLKHPQGARIKPHIHKISSKVISSIQEVLHIEYGRVEVNFYDDNGGRIESVILNMGDTMLLISGGHGFDILEDSKIIEIKQGPYGGVEQDKKPLDIPGGG